MQLALRPPQEHRGAQPMTVWVTQVSEPGPPPGGEALDWLLVSSESAATAAAALCAVRQYELRWGLEEHFRPMTTSARVEDHRLGDVASLAFDAIECWRIFDLQRLARVEPANPAAEVLELTHAHWLRVGLARLQEAALAGAGDGGLAGLSGGPVKRRSTHGPRRGCDIQAPVEHPPAPSPAGPASPDDVCWMAALKPSEWTLAAPQEHDFNSVLATDHPSMAKSRIRPWILKICTLTLPVRGPNK